MEGQSQNWLRRARRCLNKQSPNDGRLPQRQEGGQSDPPPHYESPTPLPPDYSFQIREGNQETDIIKSVDRRMSELGLYLDQLLGDPNVTEAVSAIIRKGCITTAKAIKKCNSGEYSDKVLETTERRGERAEEAVTLAWAAATPVGKPLSAAIVAANAITATAYESANACDVARRNAAFFAALAHGQICRLGNASHLDILGSH